jgi:hypothetical protein
VLINAIVANEGVGGDYNLPGVGGVSEHLLVSRHAGVEHYLAIGISLSTKGVAFIN